MTELVVLIPVLDRSHRVKPTLDAFNATVPNARVLFIASPNDEAELQALESAAADSMTVDGNYAQKINAGIEATTEPHILLGADDIFPHPVWYEAAADRLLANGVGVVGTQDLGNKRVLAGDHSTHPLVARWYTELGTIDGPGLLHEGYQHNYCDRELVDTAKARQAWVFAPDSVIEHLHPLWGKGEEDATYALGHSGFFQDRALFLHRRKLWHRRKVA